MSFRVLLNNPLLVGLSFGVLLNYKRLGICPSVFFKNDNRLGLSFLVLLNDKRLGMSFCVLLNDKQLLWMSFQFFDE